MSYDTNNVLQAVGASIKRGVRFGAMTVAVLVLGFGSWTIIGPNEQGVRVTLGKADDGSLGSGFPFKLPRISKIHKVSIQTQTDNDKLPAASSDLQDVEIEVVVNWRVNPNAVRDVQFQYKGLENYTRSVIAPMVRDAVKATSAKYTAEELIKKRDEFAAHIGHLLSETMASKGAVSERVSIVNFTFSPSFTKAIEAKVVAEQDALAAKNKLAQVQFEADQRVAQAQGEAQAIRIQASAIQSQGGADYVKLQWIKAWNGVLPTTMLGENTPIIDLR